MSAPRRGAAAVLAVVAAVAVALLIAAGRGAPTPLATAAAPTPAQAAAAPAPTTGAAGCTMATPGLHRLAPIDGRIPVVLHIGRHARPGAPLILGLPGAGQSARDFARYTGYSALADREGFSVAYPTATGTRPFWNITGTQAGKADDVAYLRRVITAALAASCADPGRVGATGVSNGGGMSARLACEAPDLLAAAAPVAGGYGSLPDCHPPRPVPIMEVHSLADRVVPYAGKGKGGAGSVRAFLEQWRRLDHCTGVHTTGRPYRDIVQTRWTHCAAGTVVQHDQVEAADHGWPGEDDLTGHGEFSSTRATWRFLTSFRRPAPR